MPVGDGADELDAEVRALLRRQEQRLAVRL
jgi:hypothetical protein